MEGAIYRAGEAEHSRGRESAEQPGVGPVVVADLGRLREDPFDICVSAPLAGLVVQRSDVADVRGNAVDGQSDREETDLRRNTRRNRRRRAGPGVPGVLPPRRRDRDGAEYATCWGLTDQ